MPAIPRKTVLCRYHYDPLDRLVDCAPSAEVGIQRFYCKSRLATEIQGAAQRSVFQHDDQLLAQLRHEGSKVETTLLATDQQRSVLNALDATQPHPLTYTPYGHRPAENGLLSLLGFNGERPDPVTGHYLLGNGYRAFNPVLMRFNSPDSWSPFGEGGLNAYAYCQGDPTNRVDPTGHYYTPVTKAIADFKQAKLGISKASIIISKAENNKAARPLSPPKTLSKSEKYKQYHREYSRTKRNDLRELTNLIKKNEAALKNENKQYMITKNITDLEQSTKGYELAKDRYNFKKYPDPNIEHPWEDPDGNTILDPSHFDIAISHFRNITREKRKHPELTGNSDTVRRLIILRAVYIKNFTGNDLMRIRQ